MIAEEAPLDIDEVIGTIDLQLDVLGRLGLYVEGGNAARILAQPRRLALLLYLVLHRPAGFVSRDRLLGLFWPESDTDRARASLRQALRFLRQWLPEGLLPSRGDDVGVEQGRVRCDAVEARKLLVDGREDEALQLYGGELLPGFFISEAPEAQRWLETERTDLRRSFLQTALDLSAAAEERSDRQAAAAYARQALNIEPTHETGARRLIRLLDEGGNRAGAVAAFEGFAFTLERQLQLEPAPETLALIRSIRERETARPAPSEGVRTKRVSTRVLVLPFENLTGDPELDVLGPMIVDWITRGLSQLRELEVLPGTGDLPTDAIDAGTVIEGRYYREDRHLYLQPRITDLAAGSILPAPEPVVVASDRYLTGIEELCRRIAFALAPALNPRATHLYMGTRPPDFDTYRAYMEGLELFIAGDWEPAAERLGKCADDAPTYALPRIVSAIANWNLSRLHDAANIAAETMALRNTIGRFERAVLDMVQAWLAGDWAAAHEADRRQAELAPGSIPSFQVAEEARRLNRLGEARSILTGLDPERGELRGWIHYWIELSTAHHLLGDHEAELNAAERACRLHPDHPAARLLEMRALAALGRLDRLDERVEQALTLPTGRMPRAGRWLHEIARELWAHGHDSAGQRQLERSLAWFAAHLDGSSSHELHRDHARALYDAGRWQPAAQIFRRLVEERSGAVQALSGHHGHLHGHLDEGYLAAIALREGEESASERRQHRLEAMDEPFLYGSNWLWLGILAVLRGEESAAVSAIRRALSEGLPFGMHLHNEPHLALLRSNPRFDSLLRPR